MACDRKTWVSWSNHPGCARLRSHRQGEWQRALAWYPPLKLPIGSVTTRPAMCAGGRALTVLPSIAVFQFFLGLERFEKNAAFRRGRKRAKIAKPAANF